MREGLGILGLLALTVVYNWSSQPSPEQLKVEQSVYYSGCNEVRLLGKDPIYRGQPGYREDMDGDGDGIACEPHRGR